MNQKAHTGDDQKKKCRQLVDLESKRNLQRTNVDKIKVTDYRVTHNPCTAANLATAGNGIEVKESINANDERTQNGSASNDADQAF